MDKYFRILGFVEAISLLLLLFVAMPLKYFYNLPEAVRIVGTIHGVLFLLYAAVGLSMVNEFGWSYRKLILACIVASIPFGPFLFDKKLFPEASPDTVSAHG